MLTLVAFSAAAALDERASFDGVIQFDALQTNVPGTFSSPVLVGSPVQGGIRVGPICISDCADSVGAVTAALNAAAGTTGTVASGCGGSCSNSRRGLLQNNDNNNNNGGQQVTFTVPGNLATASALQSQIAAGNLAMFGIPSTTVVQASTPNGLVPVAVFPVPLVPSNPASPTSLCNANTNTVTTLPCDGASQITTCLTRISALVANPPIAAFCCPCTTNQGGFAIRSTASRDVLCQRLPRSTPGCHRRSKKGLLGLLGLLGLIPLCLCLLLCCLCLLRRKRRGQAMLFSQTAVPAPLPAPLPHLHAAPLPIHSHVPMGGPDFHVHP